MKRSSIIAMLTAAVTLPKAALANTFLVRSAGIPGRWKVVSTPATGALLDVKFGYPDGSSDHGQIPLASDQIALLQSRQVLKVARDAGAFTCATALNNRLAGSVVFSADGQFALALQSSGYSTLTERDLLGLAIFNIAAPYATAAKALYPSMTTQDLTGWGVYKVDLSYARTIRSNVHTEGPTDVPMLAKAGVTIDDIKSISSLPESTANTISLLEAKGVGVDAAYIRGMGSIGYGSLPLRDMIRLKANGIDAQFIQQHGGTVRRLSADQLLDTKLAPR